MRVVVMFALAIVLFPLHAGAAEETQTFDLKFLSSGIANKIAQTAVDECTTRGYKVSAAVVSRDGNLAAFLRNPLSGPHTIEVSQRKAYSAASLQAPTSQMSSRPDLNFAPGILLIVGGVPISVAGHFYGGVAVAGADPEIDEACAQAGIDAVSDILEFAN